MRYKWKNDTIWEGESCENGRCAIATCNGCNFSKFNAPVDNLRQKHLQMTNYLRAIIVL